MPIIEWDWIRNWVEARCENIKERLQTWITAEKEVGSNAFALIIPTDSFGLAFRKGSTIIVDPSRLLCFNQIFSKIEFGTRALILRYYWHSVFILLMR